MQNNAIEVQGFGDVPSKIVSFSNQSTNLQYLKNYPWTDICVADVNVATKYNREISLLPNSQILTTYTPNIYAATGGVSVTVEPDDTVTVSLNVSSDTSLELKSGYAFTILSDRSLENMDLGSISGANYSYSFSVVNNQLVISGCGAFKQLNFFSSVRPSVKYYVNPDVQRLCYIYKYDKRNWVVEKHVLDNGWTYIVYDKMDRPTMSWLLITRHKALALPGYCLLNYKCISFDFQMKINFINILFPCGS